MQLKMAQPQKALVRPNYSTRLGCDLLEDRSGWNKTSEFEVKILTGRCCKRVDPIIRRKSLQQRNRLNLFRYSLLRVADGSGLAEWKRPSSLLTRGIW